MQLADRLALHTQLERFSGACRYHGCDAAASVHDGRHDWHCIKDEAGKQIACSSFILDLQKESSRYRMGAVSHANKTSEGGQDIREEEYQSWGPTHVDQHSR